MAEFFTYFFGQGETVEFKHFSLAHFLPIIIMLGIIALIVNGMIPGANYLYVAGPETTKSILDFLPKNYVVRLILMFLIVCVMFFLCYLPWLIKDIKTKKAKQLENAEQPLIATNTNENIEKESNTAN